MTDPDLSPEAVERLARRIETREPYKSPMQIMASDMPQEPVILGQGDYPTPLQIADTATRNANEAATMLRALSAALTEAARLAATAHLVPPDGGSPSEAECNVAQEAERRILWLLGGDVEQRPDPIAQVREDALREALAAIPGADDGHQDEWEQGRADGLGEARGAILALINTGEESG